MLRVLIVKRVLRWLEFAGMDRAVAVTVLGRLAISGGGVVTVFFIAAFLSPSEQGYWYTFGSILALQVLFELGLSNVVLQFASHETASLEWTEPRRLAGDDRSLARLSSVLRLAVKWYSAASVLLVVVIVPVGWAFFSRQQSATGPSPNWELPWVMLVISAAASMSIAPLFTLVEGCGKVAEVALLRSISSVSASAAVWFGLAVGIQLYAVVLGSVVPLVLSAVWLIARFRNFLRDLLLINRPEARVDWRREVWPFQWRIAVSWLAGYFISQLFTPVLFASQGPVVAGQMGMSLAMVAVITTIAMAWVTTKAPFFGQCVSAGDIQGLDRVFFPALKRSLAVVVAMSSAAWLTFFALDAADVELAARVLPLLPLALLLTTVCVNHVVLAEAVYLRAHKREPFLVISLAVGGLTAASTMTLGRQYGALGVTSGYLLVSVSVGLIGGSWIFRRKRRQWHDPAKKANGRDQHDFLSSGDARPDEIV